MTLVPLVVWAADKVPEDEDVVAGWTAFAIFGLLIVAVVFLGFSLVKQLRKVDQAEAAGLYDPSDRKRPSRRGKSDTPEDADEE
jgi:hypothetical protein